jgi:sugar lactone lactonase YvrE
VYLGVFGLASGGLLRADPDGSVRVVAEALLLPNGQVITPDGGTLIVAESAGQRLTAFDIRADGGLAGRRMWARFGEAATATSLPEVVAQVTLWPDGLALDAEGRIWVANPLGKEVLRVREDPAG